MSIPMLVVDTDIEVNEREVAAWLEHGIPTVRVDTMCEAVEKLNSGMYLFTAINGDSINYLPMLKVLSEVSPTPVFLIKKQITIYEQIKALHNGADACSVFQTHVEDNITYALALLAKYNDKNRAISKKPLFISYAKLFVFPRHCRVFYGNNEIKLTKKELNTLIYLIENRGIVLTYKQLYRKIWGLGYDDSSNDVLYSHMKRLRNKIANATGTQGYIENVKETGYRLPTYIDK